MRAVVATDSGVLEINWMWLPTFVGLNAALKAELEKELAAKLEGAELTEASLDRAHMLVVQYLEKKFPALKGIENYLDALKYVYYA